MTRDEFIIILQKADFKLNRLADVYEKDGVTFDIRGLPGITIKYHFFSYEQGIKIDCEILLENVYEEAIGDNKVALKIKFKTPFGVEQVLSLFTYEE